MSSKLNNIHSLLRVDYEHTHQYFIHITKLLHTSDYSGSHTYTHTSIYTDSAYNNIRWHYSLSTHKLHSHTHILYAQSCLILLGCNVPSRTHMLHAHTCMSTLTHTQTHAHPRALTYARAHARAHSRTYSPASTHTHEHSRAHPCTQPLILRHMHTHSRAHMPVHTHTRHNHSLTSAPPCARTDIATPTSTHNIQT